MSDTFGSDFITIVDEDNNEYELEVLSTMEYNGSSYMAVVPAGEPGQDQIKYEVSILKSVEDDDGPILCAIENLEELEAVEQLMMDQLYADSDTEQ